MNYISYLVSEELVAFSGITNLIVGIYIYLFSYKLSKKNYTASKYFAYICFSIFIWTLWVIVQKQYLSLINYKIFVDIFNSLNYISFITIIQALVFFAISFNNKIDHKYNFLYYPYIIAIISIILSNIDLFNKYSTFLFYIIALYIILYLLFYIKLLIDKYNITNNKYLRINILLLLSFTIFPIIIIFITNIIYPMIYNNITFIYYGPVSTLVILISIIIGILKYNLFNIKLPIATLLITLIFTLILLITRVSIIDKYKSEQLLNNLLFILMFSFLYIFLIREAYMGFKKQLLLDSRKQELELALDSKNNFLKSSSHQFRTPLTVILGYLSMILNKENLKYEYNNLASEYLQKTYVSAKNLNEIINDVLLANEINTGKFEINMKDTVNLEKLIKSIIYEKQELLNSKMTKVNFEVKGDNENAILDLAKFKEAVNNIFDNAIFYGKGKIKIVLNTNSKNFFEISIKDNGVGIKSSDERKIWMKFERGKNSPKINPNGSGLGLYLAKQIISQHGGDIKLYSKGLNKGSKFTIIIPKNINLGFKNENFNKK